MNRKAKIVSVEYQHVGPTLEEYITEQLQGWYLSKLFSGEGLPPGILSGAAPPDRDTRQRRRAEARKSGEKLLR